MSSVAVPGARRPRSSQGGVDLVWLRLQTGQAVDQQIRELPANLASLPCIVLSDAPSDDDALTAFSAGARGYANTHCDPAVLQQIAAVVMQGGLWIGTSLMQRLITSISKIPLPQAATAIAVSRWDEKLTEREAEVAQTLATGASNKEIAFALGITERTVKAHVGAILEKLNVRDRLQLSLVVNGRISADV